jgi:hypothetical protein
MQSGLKDLSKLVLEQVVRVKRTSYKEVASSIIDKLKSCEGLGLESNHEISIEGEDLEEGSLKMCERKELVGLEKGEKNIRRRVYDALNV